MRALLIALACAVAVAPDTGSGPSAARWRGKAHGICFEGPPRAVGAEALDGLALLGVNAISLTPFAFMREARKPELGFSDPSKPLEGRGWWGEHAEGIRFVTRAARERDIGMLLKPHVWLHGSWPGAVEMDSDEDWATWFASYREFLLGWARFAAAEEIEGLCIGNELDKTALREREWRALIAEVRGVFPGLLVYAANWTDFEAVPFWDALDAIGVNAYFPLAQTTRPEVGELTEAWRPIHARLEALSRRFERPVVFTEIGYHPAEGSTKKPWVWEAGEAAFVPECQARAYEAALRVFLDEPWFGGVFWWKWHAEAGRRRRGGPADTFSPQGLPAEEVLKRFYGGNDD